MIEQRLSRQEAHDLGMLIKERSRVLRAHAEEQAAACMADFEKKLASVYEFDRDEVWKAATEKAIEAVKEAQEIIAKRCEDLGIPRTFAPSISASWSGRGENALNDRRTELRRVAKSSIEAMTKSAITRIEKQSLDLRTQVVSMGLLSDTAKIFLESLAPVEEAMGAIEFDEIERRLDQQQQKRLADRRRLYGDLT